MNDIAFLKQLQHYQQTVLAHCRQTNSDHTIQYHQDLSPIGWHLGHCIYTENYWIREVLLNNGTGDDTATTLYVPENMEKSKRGGALPQQQELYEWAQCTQTENQALLRNTIGNSTQHELLQNNFLLKFLIQHYAQHYETLQLIANQAALKKTISYTSQKPLTAMPLNHTISTIEQGNYQIGADIDNDPYDNEYPRHEVELNRFQIAHSPVSNAEYLNFIQAGGYETRAHWSEAAWQWKEQNAIQQPEYWQQDQHENCML